MAREADPMTQIAGLERSVDKDGLARGYVLKGPENWFKERALAVLRKAAAEREAETCVHDGKDPDFSLSGALDDLAGSALFASERFIVLRGVDAHLKKSGKQDASLTRALAGFVSRDDSGGTVVVTSDGLRADHAVAKAIKKSGGPILGCRKLYDSPPPWDRNADPARTELVQWFQGRCREAGVTLSRDESVLIAASVGNDLFALDTLVEKLKTSGKAAVIEELGISATAKPFAIADDLVSGKIPNALFELETLFRGGFQQDGGKREVGAPALVAILTSALLRSVRRGLAGAEVLERGGDMQAAAEAAGVSSNRMAMASFESSVGSRPRVEWEQMLEEVCALDRRAKTGARPEASDFASIALAWRQRARRAARQRAAGSHPGAGSRR